MGPIRYAGVVAFLDWVSRVHPRVQNLRELHEDEFLRLAVEYERSKGLTLSPDHQVYQKWRTTHWIFTDSATQSEALKRLGGP